MKTLSTFGVLLALLFAGLAHAADQPPKTKYLCSISVSNSSVNSSATSGCNGAQLAGTSVQMQCDIATYIGEATGTASTVATSGDSVKVAADALYDFKLRGRYWALITASGSGTCKFWSTFFEK